MQRLDSKRSSAVVLCLLAAACGDDGAGGMADAGGTGGSGGTAGSGGAGAIGGGGSGGTGGTLDASTGQLGPSARIRIANIVPATTFDAWGPNIELRPVLAQGDIAYASVTDYFDVQLNMVAQHPIFVVLPDGEEPDTTSGLWLNQESGPDRSTIDVREIDGPDEQATVVLKPSSNGENLAWEQLDETELNTGDPTKANLHISYNLFDLTNGAVISFAVVGQPCFHDGSTNIAQVWSVEPGSFELGVYDQQTVSECTTPIATVPIEAAAGDNVLVVVYHEDNAIKFLTAPVAVAE